MAFQPEENSVPTSIPFIRIILFDNTGDPEAGIPLGKHARFSLSIFDQNNEVMGTRAGDLVPHITPEQRQTLLDVVAEIRADAEDKILP